MSCNGKGNDEKQDEKKAMGNNMPRLKEPGERAWARKAIKTVNNNENNKRNMPMFKKKFDNI